MNWQDLHDRLDFRLTERSRLLRPEAAAGHTLDGGFVLYWMRNAARAHENPALDVAVAAGNHLDRPAFVYHALAEGYPYASDRHHTFALEGAREVSAACDDRGIGYALHVQREGHRQAHLRELCERAALVVVEEVPVDPMRRWHAALAAEITTPVVAVDADCVVPMRLVGRLYDRAYKYRDAVADLREERIGRDWEDVEPTFEAELPESLPFEPIAIADRSIPDIVARCEIDHAVGPVPRTPGGASAGYARWRAFRDERLDDYHDTRNAPSYPDGVSRLSPYLHWGHVSPLRIARQAAARDSRGADKFIDELVTWREMAHHFCFYEPAHASVDALPEWARATLRTHESDPRPALHDWETLARAETGDRLWNLCQTSLLRHGELHNNIRMTWAKKLLEWTPDVERALALAIDLNHRYGLDGRDPNSYLGILWCFGAFDRPSDRERPIIGEVRPRDTGWHADRVDMERLEQHVTAPPVANPPSVAIVGAGMAGATCARILRDHGLEVRAFDKGRGAGGRRATRRVDAEEAGELAFDHGAQYFTARDQRFVRYVEAWREQGRVAPWEMSLAVLDEEGIHPKPGGPVRFVGVPQMNAVAGHIAEGAGAEYGIGVERIARRNGGWRLSGAKGGNLGDYDALVLTPPAEQTAELLEGVDSSVLDAVRGVDMQPTWTVMVAFDGRLPVAFDAAFVHDGPIDWIARNRAKPDRPTTECWVLHSTHEWAEAHLEQSPETVAETLIGALRDRLGSHVDWPDLLHLDAHRWRYAEAAPPLDGSVLWDAERSLAVAGDWVDGSRVEGAFLSGCAAAGRILSTVETA